MFMMLDLTKNAYINLILLLKQQEIMRLNEVKSSFEPWSLKKSGILSKYTTVEKLTITSSFLTPIAGAVKDKGKD